MPVGVVASLVVMPPGSAPGYDGYLITQGMLSLNHMTMSEAGRAERDITLPLDARLMRLHAGTRLELKISPVAMTTVHGLPWVHPLLVGHTVTILTGPGVAAAVLTIPVAAESSFSSLPKANVTLLLRGYWTW